MSKKEILWNGCYDCYISDERLKSLIDENQLYMSGDSIMRKYISMVGDRFESVLTTKIEGELSYELCSSLNEIMIQTMLGDTELRDLFKCIQNYIIENKYNL